VLEQSLYPLRLEAQPGAERQVRGRVHGRDDGALRGQRGAGELAGQGEGGLDAASIAAMCLMSAPTAKNRSTAEDTTRTLTSPAASAASSAACSPSSSGPLSALAGGEAIVTRQIPGAAGTQVTTSFGSAIGTCLSTRLYPERAPFPPGTAG